MLYLCIARPRISCSGRASPVSFCPFRPKNRPGEGFTKCFVIFSAGFVVLRKSFVIFSKCFPLKTTKPRDCFRRLKTLKFGPTYLWKTTPRKATVGGARTAPPPPRGRHGEAPPTPELPPQRAAGKWKPAFAKPVAVDRKHHIRHPTHAKTPQKSKERLCTSEASA